MAEQDAGDFSYRAGATSHQTDAANDAQNDAYPLRDADHLLHDALRRLTKRARLGKRERCC